MSGDLVAYDPERDGDIVQPLQVPVPYDPAAHGEIVPAGPRLAQSPGEDLRNIGGGIVDAVKSIYTDPINTGKALQQGIGNVVTGLGSKIARATGLTDAAATVGQSPEGAALNRDIEAQKAAIRERAPNAIGAHLAESYGGLPQIVDSVTKRPFSTALDVGTILSGGEMLPGRLGLTVGAVNKAVDPITNAQRLLTTVPGYATSAFLGKTAGTGGKVVRQAYRDSAAGGDQAKAFRENYTGAQGAEDVRQLGDSALAKMRQDRSADYNSNMASVKADKSTLDYAPIDNALNDAQKKIVQPNGFVVDPVAKAKLDEMRNIVMDHQTTPGQMATPADFDALKQRLGVVQQSTDHTSRSRSVTDDVYNATKGEIVNNAPEYAKAMADYEQASNKLREMQKTFSLAEGSSTDTAARKLLSTARHNVTTNFGYRDKLMQELAQKEPTLPSAIAGQTLNSWQPRGLIANGEMSTAAALALLHNPYLVAALPMFSPKVVGGAAYAAGLPARGLSAAGINAQRVRAGLLAVGQTGRVPGLLDQ